MVESKYFMGTWGDNHRSEAQLMKSLERFVMKVANITHCCPLMLGGLEQHGHLHVHGNLLVPAEQLARFERRLQIDKARRAWTSCSGAWKFDLQPFVTGRSHTYTFAKHRPVAAVGCSRHGPCARGCVTKSHLPIEYQEFFRRLHLKQ